jgi:hypothetical protein
MAEVRLSKEATAPGQELHKLHGAKKIFQKELHPTNVAHALAKQIAEGAGRAFAAHLEADYAGGATFVLLDTDIVMLEPPVTGRASAPKNARIKIEVGNGYCAYGHYDCSVGVCVYDGIGRC